MKENLHRLQKYGSTLIFRMKIVRFVENNVSLVLLAGIPIGLLLPYFGALKWSLKYILMFVLFVSFLKIDLDELKKLLKAPLLPLYVSIANLVCVPVILFFALTPFKPKTDLLAALLLLSAVPSGVASSAMTELSGGNTALTLIITIFSHFIAPFSIPFVFYILIKKTVRIDYIGISLTMAELILIPFILALLFEKLLPKGTEKIKGLGTFLTAIPISFISLIVMSVNASFIYKHPVLVLKYLLVVYAVYFAFLFTGLAEVFFLKDNKKKIAVVNSKIFMNVSIGIVLAIQFFTPEVALIITLSQIPWPTMLPPVNYLYKKMRIK